MGGPASRAVSADSVNVYPNKDGTLVDGGVHGSFGGGADGMDWFFNGFGNIPEGAITRSVSDPDRKFESRLVFEYDLLRVTYTAPVTATLHFNLRSAPVFPIRQVEVFVFSYPADLLEQKSDYDEGPAELQGHAVTINYGATKSYVVDVSPVVDAALLSGVKKVGFRFQINPATSNPDSQAFIDAKDSDPTTKPTLVVKDSAPGEVDGDGVASMGDVPEFETCMMGPSSSRGVSCELADFDSDGDVDLRDYQFLHRYFATR